MDHLSGTSSSETSPLLSPSDLETRGECNGGSADAGLLPQRDWNPLPWRQLSIVLFVQLSVTSITSVSRPFINQLVGDLDIIAGDKRKIGYYVGMIGSSHSVALTLAAFHWTRLSDYIGRKPVLLTGMFGSVFSILCFGFSRTLLGLVASQFLHGLLDGSAGVIYSVIGEITDSTNRTTGFSLAIVLWSIGAGIGSVIGGTLARPNDRFPDLFTNEFWTRYPYFLPCFSVSVLTATAFFITLFLFKETISKKPFPGSIDDSEESPIPRPDDEPVPIRQLMTYPIIISLMNYSVLDLLYFCHGSLLALFFAMPIELGGVGLDPASIGYILGGYRAITALFMATASSKLVRYLGERRSFMLAILSVITLWILPPMINHHARHFGLSTTVWVSIAFLAAPMCNVEMGYACAYIFITAAAPNKRSLGATNGLAHAIISAGRILSPVAATSLYSLSIERNLLGGYGVYAIFFVLSCFAALLALRLPRQVRPAWEAETAIFEP